MNNTQNFDYNKNIKNISIKLSSLCFNDTLKYTLQKRNEINQKVINILKKPALDCIQNYSNEITEIVSKTMGSIKNIYKTINIDSLMHNNLFKIAEELKIKLNNLNLLPSSRISGFDSDMLDKYYWVIPFEYDYEKVRNLSKFKRRSSFEQYMIKYFNDNRVKRLFSKIKYNTPDKDKKILLKQIETSYFNGDYALCITALVTMLDGLTLPLITSDSKNQHNSHKVIQKLLEYMNDCDVGDFSYETYLKVDILNNFYLKFFCNENNLKSNAIKNKRILIRHINSHGVKYLNNQINVLRLLNVIYYCQQIMEEVELNNQFILKNQNKILMV